MSKRIIEISVNDEYVVGSGVVIGAEGSDNSVILRAKFNDTWVGLNIYATFRDAKGENPTVELLLPTMLQDGKVMTYDIEVPKSATAIDGKMCVVFSGFAVSEVSSYEIKTGTEENIKLVYRDAVINTTNAYFRVLPSDFSALDVKDEAEATVLEKVLSEINGFDEKETERRAAENERESAEQERETAEKARDKKIDEIYEAYESGQLKGEKGDPGSVNVVQTPGDSETDAMSQKATTEYVKEYIPKVGTRNLANVNFENAALSTVDGSFIKVNTGLDHVGAPEYIEVTGGETYTFSWKTDVIRAGLEVFQYTDSKTLIKITSVSVSALKYTVTLDETCRYVRIHIYAWDTGIPWEDVLLKDFQCEHGTVATEYILPQQIDNSLINAKELAAKMPPSKFDHAALGVPTIEFNGDISSMSKDNAVTLSYKYGDRSGTCTLKWQGSSSVIFPKKNYTVKFDTAFEAKGADSSLGSPAWGEQKKYCLKADWVDFSHCRNVVTARLWGQLLRSRRDSFEYLAKLKGLTNGGAIDGFPCFVVINGEWQGIYNFNIPKDGWMLGMGEGTKEAIVCADWTGAKCAFKTTEDLRTDGSPYDFEIEYVTDEDNAEWVQTSLNTLIQACIDCDGTDLSTIEQYLDINSAIDYYILVTAMCGSDNIKKNYLLSTYDGTKWFFTPYDMDGTWGMTCMGDSFEYVGDREYVRALSGVTIETARYFKTVANTHRLMEIIYKYMPRRLIDRYKYVRERRLSSGYLEYLLEYHIRKIPMTAFEEEAKKWKTIPSTQVSNANQITRWAREKLEILDYEIELLESSLASTNEA